MRPYFHDISLVAFLLRFHIFRSRYRARCFNNSDEVDRYRKIIDGTAPKDEIMQLEDVLQRFQEDMVTRGSWKGPLPAADDSAGRLKFATAILDTYVKYPLPTSVRPLVVCFFLRLMMHRWSDILCGLVDCSQSLVFWYNNKIPCVCVVIVRCWCPSTTVHLVTWFHF